MDKDELLINPFMDVKKRLERILYWKELLTNAIEFSNVLSIEYLGYEGGFAYYGIVYVDGSPDFYCIDFNDGISKFVEGDWEYVTRL